MGKDKMMDKDKMGDTTGKDKMMDKDKMGDAMGKDKMMDKKQSVGFPTRTPMTCRRERAASAGTDPALSSGNHRSTPISVGCASTWHARSTYHDREGRQCIRKRSGG